MPLPERADITRLLHDWAAGDAAALDRLTPQVYKELRRIAANCLRNEREGCSIQATALVHEAYLRLVELKDVDWERRAHLFVVAVRVMRHILLDAARKRGAARRGGNAVKLELDQIPDFNAGRGGELVALGDPFTRMEHVDPRKGAHRRAKVFGGLSVGETAAVLRSPRRPSCETGVCPRLAAV